MWLAPIAFHRPHLVICALRMTGLDTGSPFYLLPFSRRKGQKLVEGSPHSISHSNTVALLVSCLPEALWHTSPYRSCRQLTSSMLSSTGWVNLLEKVHHWVTALQRVLVANFLSGSSVDQQFHCHDFAAQSCSFPGVADDLQSTYKMW